jgi:glycosyltransferase involved in cell wall biosynthesis
MSNGFVINGRFSGRRITGVERYAGEIIRRLPGQVRFVAPHAPIRGPFMGHLWEQVMLPCLAGRDLIWSPANSGPVLGNRQVVTIHDVMVLDHPEWFNPQFATWYRFLIPSLAHRAKKILTVSEYSKKRLVQYIGLAPSKVIVIPAGVSTAQFHPISTDEKIQFHRKFHLPAQYLLFVGSNEPGKNLKRLIEAWKMMNSCFPEVELVIAGAVGRQFAPGILPEAPGIRTLGYIEDIWLASLYAGAEALLLPSLDEGFGLPALEAMACGTPVLAANAGAIPETTGEAALLVNPKNAENMATAMRQILVDRDLHVDLVAKGFKRAAQFSWDETARAVWRVLEMVQSE